MAVTPLININKNKGQSNMLQMLQSEITQRSTFTKCASHLTCSPAGCALQQHCQILQLSLAGSLILWGLNPLLLYNKG